LTSPLGTAHENSILKRVETEELSLIHNCNKLRATETFSDLCDPVHQALSLKIGLDEKVFENISNFIKSWESKSYFLQISFPLFELCLSPKLSISE
jgi:hypothetical protein